MVMLVGEDFTKLSNHLLCADKEYTCTLKLGAATPSYDKATPVCNESGWVPTLADIEAIIPEFTGPIQQIPPMYSAKSVDGRRLYELARQGKNIKRQPIDVKIKQLKILNYTYPELTVHVECSKGTYIRVLAHDMGLRLGCFAHAVALRRTRSGKFR